MGDDIDAAKMPIELQDLCCRYYYNANYDLFKISSEEKLVDYCYIIYKSTEQLQFYYGTNIKSTINIFAVKFENTFYLYDNNTRQKNNIYRIKSSSR